MSTGSGNDAMDAMHTLAVLVSRALNTLNPNPALAQTVYKLAQSHPTVETFYKAIAVFGRFSLQQVQSSLLHFRGGVPRELTTPEYRLKRSTTFANLKTSSNAPFPNQAQPRPPHPEEGSTLSTATSSNRTLPSARGSPPPTVANTSSKPRRRALSDWTGSRPKRGGKRRRSNAPVLSSDSNMTTRTTTRTRSRISRVSPFLLYAFSCPS